MRKTSVSQSDLKSFFKGSLLFALICLGLGALPALYEPRASAQETPSHDLDSTAGTAPIKYLPVQDAGRVKPFDTFARESLQLVYGKQTYVSERGVKRPAREVVMTWMIAPQFWDDEKIVQINHRGLKDALKLEQDRSRFSPNELFKNQRLPLVIQDLGAKRETKEKLGPYYQSASRLENALGLYQAIKNGSATRVLPPPKVVSGSDANLESAAKSAASASAASDRWIAVENLQGEGRDRFMAMARAFIRALPQTPNSPPVASEPGDVSLQKAVDEFISFARKINPEAYGDSQKIAVEVHYYDFSPFQWAWGFYLFSALAMAFAWHRSKSKIAYRVAWSAVIAAFLLHTYGFALRVYLTGRPPVSNMYESVVWVSWGAVLFSLIFEFLYRKRFAALAGAAVGTICLIVADMAPAILDESMQPLEPVLRSNYWLTIHVLTITLSYSAFFLAWGLATIGLTFILRGDAPTSERVRGISLSLYRALQIGTVLLAAGTILGGIWADYSWGRFWGWDPKETWAFIALLGYLAILHGRLAGWLQGFGLMASSVIAFSLVIMAWYGVNYVLGAGLHTYGFGAGGVQYVAGFVALNFIYVGYVAFVRSARKKT